MPQDATDSLEATDSDLLPERIANDLRILADNMCHGCENLPASVCWQSDQFVVGVGVNTMRYCCRCFATALAEMPDMRDFLATDKVSMISQAAEVAKPESEEPLKKMSRVQGTTSSMMGHTCTGVGLRSMNKIDVLTFQEHKCGLNIHCRLCDGANFLELRCRYCGGDMTKGKGKGEGDEGDKGNKGIGKGEGDEGDKGNKGIGKGDDKGDNGDQRCLVAILRDYDSDASSESPKLQRG
jgi:hypothetical protein